MYSNRDNNDARMSRRYSLRERLLQLGVRDQSLVQHLVTMRKAVLLLAASFFAIVPMSPPVAGQAAPASAPIRDIRYEVTFTRANGERREVGSAMTFTVGGTDPVILSLPKWTPGAYEIANFSRDVVNFSAEQTGSSLTWDKINPDTWRIRPRGVGEVTVRFDYLADSLDNANSWSRPDFLLFNGTNLFLYPAGRPLDFPASLSVNTEAGWKVVTGMPSAGAHQYSASNYHDLVDFPFFVGQFDVDSTQISGTWVRFATYPSGSVTGGPRIAVWEALKLMIPVEVKVFQEVPWTNYTVLQIADPSYGGGSGLEHQNSHVDVLGTGMLGTPVLPSLYAHEIFHAWNVKRLRPSDLWPYHYDGEQPTTLLWISEGITDYYADLAEERGGVTSPQGFYEATSDKISQVEELPPTSLEDASLSTWVHPRDGTEYIYYPKGSLAGLLIDIMIRDASDNHASLDDVMRGLYNADYKSGRGFTNEEWWAAVSRAANGKSFADFAARYIDGREPFPYDRVLPLAGLRLARDTARVPQLGIASLQDSTGLRVTSVIPGSAAAAAGVQPGDQLISVAGFDAADPNWTERFRGRYARVAEGTDLPVVIKRDGNQQTLTAHLHFVLRIESKVVEDARASGNAKRIRSGLLTGTTN